MITTSIDGKPATAANGGTLAIAAGAFVAYLRDPDGNELTARTQPMKLRKLRAYGGR